MDTARNLRADAFAGTAEDYLRYRPPYPAALLADLTRRMPPAPAVLVDLACGPGRIALELAARFERVVAIDLEPDMVKVGGEEAERRGITNVDWRVGRAEDADIAPASADLITIGEAFHRLDQAIVIDQALRWLKPDGRLAILGTRTLMDGVEPWQAAVARRWMDAAHPEGWAPARSGAASGPEALVRLLRQSGFVDVDSRSFSEPRAWSVEQIIGFLRSTSVCSERAVGGAWPRLEAELLATLAGEAGPPYQEQLSAGCVLGRRPGDV